MAAEGDILSAKKLASEVRLTNIAAFHCQQCLEKAFKGWIEEQNKQPIKSHDLIRLNDLADITHSEKQNILLAPLMKYISMHVILEIWD